MADTDSFIEIQIPQQKTYNSIPFPSVLSAGPSNFSVSSLTETIKTQKPFLDSLLHKTGAILFRGFSLDTAKDFNDVVEAFDYEELPYIGGAAPRNKVVGRVYTTNESPPQEKIPFHHEMAQVTEFPSKLFFFCEVEAVSGGETPIVLSHIVYERMKERYPEFVERLEEHGLKYTRILGDDDDNSSAIGRGWKSTFLTEDKSVAEERAAQIGTKLKWTVGGAKSIMGPVPAIRFDKSRQRKVWFNSMVIAYIGWKDARNDPEKAVTFGDGKPLPADIVYDCFKIIEEESVAIPWRRGDVLLVDNWAVLHSRRSFTPPRRVLASLCK
ncbi:TauD domain-containing protein [Cephalotus follicularis]|uniref:TauD domain-containing protein n=1 Tax=Cephalotus follicularis TaxID=3775 RepID=A0A1Q3AZR8_CEPFO|nr:TauD domain-containing protein [Cephalotus follicularis]